MAIDVTSRIVVASVTSTNAVLATAAQANSTTLTNTMNGIISAPPLGYVTGSIKLQPTVFIFDGTDWNVITVFTYNTVY